MGIHSRRRVTHRAEGARSASSCGRHPETDPDRVEAVAAAGGFDIAEVYRELFA